MNAIEIRDLHISYKTVHARSIKKTLLSLKKSQTTRYEAVKGVSFDVRRGEIIGLVGKNGSGKSTLLRAVAGIFSPDSGSIELKGNTVSLLAIGIGFQNDLTGKENIFLSGLLLGFTEEQIREKYKEIVEFSELGEFINAPVKTYSSGMHSKLAFSITAILETDIILVDETLSVGDRRFKKKSYKKMQELISNEDRTVVIVSHSSDTIKKLCTRVIWLNDGEIVQDGPTKEVLEAYNRFMDGKSDENGNKERETKIDANRILFYPVHGVYCDNMKAICEYVIRERLTYRMDWVVRKNDTYTVEDYPKELNVVVEGTPEFSEAVASAGILIDNGMNFARNKIKKHRNQKLIKFLAGGSLGIKDIGPTIGDENLQLRRKKLGEKSRKMTTYCISDSSFESWVFRNTFWQGCEVLEIGHPRVDILFAEEGVKREICTRIRERYGVSEQTRIAMYAPTYCEEEMQGHVYEAIDYEQIRQALKARFGGEWVFFVRFHSRDDQRGKELLQQSTVIDVTGYPDIMELMLIVDVGITDYSSWIFDYALQKKAGFIYAPDLKAYEACRGFYYPINETPFPIAGSNQELANNIVGFEEEEYQECLAQFVKEKGCVERGDSCKHFFEVIGS